VVFAPVARSSFVQNATPSVSVVRWRNGLNNKKPPITPGGRTDNTPAIWTTQFRYQIQNGIVKLAFGEDNTIFVTVAMPLDMATDLLAKLGGSVRDVLTSHETARVSLDG
jgi:hypothetical protein